MKKNPGRRQRRSLFFATRREFGKRRSKFHSHYYHEQAIKARKIHRKGAVVNGNREENREEV